MAILVKKLPKTAKSYEALDRVNVEDDIHESEISKGEVFYLQKTPKGYFLYDVDTESQSFQAYKFEIDKVTFARTEYNGKRLVELREKGRGAYIYMAFHGRKVKYYINDFDEAQDVYVRVLQDNYLGSRDLGTGAGDVHNSKGQLVGQYVGHGRLVEPMSPGNSSVRPITKLVALDKAKVFPDRNYRAGEEGVDVNQLSALDPKAISKAVTSYRKFLNSNKLEYQFQPSHINHHYYFNADGDVMFGISDTMSKGGNVSVNIGANTPIGKKLAKVINTFPGEDMTDGRPGEISLPESFLIYLDNPKFHLKPASAFAQAYINK